MREAEIARVDYDVRGDPSTSAVRPTKFMTVPPRYVRSSNAIPRWAASTLSMTRCGKRPDRLCGVAAVPYARQAAYADLCNRPARRFRRRAYCRPAGKLLPVLALVSEIRVKNRLARTLLETYVGSHASELILAGATRRGTGTTVRAAILICDLRDFTRISDNWPRDDVIDLLNGYFDAMSEPIARHGRGNTRNSSATVCSPFFRSASRPPAQICCAPCPKPARPWLP